MNDRVCVKPIGYTANHSQYKRIYQTDIQPTTYRVAYHVNEISFERHPAGVEVKAVIRGGYLVAGESCNLLVFWA